MFERHNSFDTPGIVGEGGGRRAFAWSELSARLAAVRDMRTVMAKAASPAGGSFRRVGALALDRSQQNEGAVNPNDLGDGKANGAEVAPDATGAQIVDREAK